VLIVHGSGGISGAEDHWASELNALGLATFTLDGFTGRGIINTGQDQSQLGLLSMVNDSYRALDLIAKHPRINPSRIAIIGNSRGGTVALRASMKRFLDMYGSREAAFVAFVGIYASCSTRYIDDDKLVQRPIQLFHGAADDVNPVNRCRELVGELRRAGTDIELREYERAHHLFDNPIMPLLRGVQNPTTRNCPLVERPTGNLVVRGTDRTFTFDDPCVEKGVTMGYDARAHQQAVHDVTAFLKAVLTAR
jgi:dienelactone hydrolase